MTNVMIDLETAATCANAAILSIAAVEFNADGLTGKEFYTTVDLSGQEQYGRIINPDTLKWWLKQNQTVRDEAFSGTTTLVTAVREFNDFMNGLGTRVLLWGNGSDFDNPIIRSAIEACGFEISWHRGRCYRTLKGLGLSKPNVAFDKNKKHNALWDAQYQAKCAVHWLRELRDLTKKSVIPPDEILLVD